MKKINIAYITKEDSGDVSQWSGTSLNIFNCLNRAGFNTIRIGPFSSYFENILKLIEIIFRLFKIKYDPERSIFLSKIYANKIKRQILNKKIDLIFVHDCPIVSFLQTKIPIVIWTDLTFDLYQKTYFFNYLKFHHTSKTNGNYLEALSLKKGKLIIYSTKYAANNALKKYKIPKKKIKIVPFGTNSKPVSSKTFKILQKKRLDRQSQELKFLSVGVDWKRKNMEKSILVVKEINSLGVKSTITIVGSVPPSDFKVPKFVKIVPFLSKRNLKDQNKLRNLYLSCDYFILLSKAEAFGLVIQEAKSYGLPIITNNIDGIKYITDKSYTILNNKNKIPKKIATKILSINKKKYVQLSEKSYLSSYNNNWDLASKKIKKIINMTLKKNENRNNYIF